MQIVEKVDGRSLQHQIAGGGVFLKRLGDFRPWTQACGQCVRDIRQRISRTVRHDELTLAEQLFSLMPICDVAKSVHADKEEKFVAALEGLLQTTDRVD